MRTSSRTGVWRIAGPAGVATGAASLLWTVVILDLTAAGRIAIVGALVAAELCGSFAARLFERFDARHRFIGAVIAYSAVRAGLVPLARSAVSMWAMLAMCVIAGCCWRLLSAEFSAAAAGTQDTPDRSTRVAWVSSWVSAGALTGTVLAALLQLPASVWSSVALLILIALTLPHVRTGAPIADSKAASGLGRRRVRVPRRLLFTSVCSTAAVLGVHGISAVVVAVTAGRAWVALAAVVAGAANFVVPFVAARADNWSLVRLGSVALAGPLVWCAAPLSPMFAVAAWAMSAVIVGTIDVQLDSRAAVGDDPAAVVARLQTSQAVTGAVVVLCAAPLFASVNVWAAAAAAGAVGLFGVIALIARPEQPAGEAAVTLGTVSQHT